MFVAEPNIYSYILLSFFFTPSTKNLVAPNNIVTTSTTFIVRIPLASSMVHDEKPKKFNRLNFKRWQWCNHIIQGVFGSVVVVAFQSAFHSEKCANNIFLFFKNHFWDQHIKMIWKHQKHITSKKKKFKFFRKCFWKALPNRHSIVSPTFN